MRKFIRKMNRGILVTSIVVLLVVGYLVVLSISQKQAVPDIKAACEAYVEADAAWRVLPQKFTDGEIPPSDSEVKIYIDSLEPEISPYYADNESIRENALSSISSSMSLQIHTGKIYTSYEKNIVKYGAITFRDNTATVNFSSQTVINYLDIASGSTEPVRTSGETTDQIILQKEDGKWKIVYASLSLLNMGGY